MTGREKSPERENDRERYYGKDGLTKSRAIGITILMGALLLFQLTVFLTRKPAEERAPDAERPERMVSKADTLFRFNPNTISADSLVLLGFTPGQAQVVLNYREKGGVFRRKEDFAKIYSVSARMYERLQDYITVPAGRTGSGGTASEASAGRRRPVKRHEGAEEHGPKKAFRRDSAAERIRWWKMRRLRFLEVETSIRIMGIRSALRRSWEICQEPPTPVSIPATRSGCLL